jgi:hypothetical protein
VVNRHFGRGPGTAAAQRFVRFGALLRLIPGPARGVVGTACNNVQHQPERVSRRECLIALADAGESTGSR